MSTQKRSLSESEALRKKHQDRRTSTPTIVVEGVGKGSLVVLGPKEMTDLVVDERYQRLRVTNAVNDLIHVLREGGRIPDPGTLAKRPDGTLAIIDGQQRMWAHLECKLAMTFMVYPVRDFDSERDFFLAMNRTRSISSRTTVKAWAGEGAALLREAAGKDDHPLFGLVHWTDGPGTGLQPFEAPIVAKGMMAAAIGLTGSKEIERVLHRLDTALAETQAARERAEAFLKLAAAAFPHDERVRLLPMVALGAIAYQRWLGKHPAQPSDSTLNALRRLNWAKAAPGYASKYLPMFEAVIGKRWAAAE